MQLKPFEQIDYDSYAGVESVEPLVSEKTIGVTGKENEWEGDAIADGKFVQLHLATPNMDKQVVLQKIFDSGYEAILFLQKAPQRTTVAYWINNGFEII